jgi:hypothetical protein
MAEAVTDLAGKETKLKSSAYSLIIYENEFKRNFIRDYENILGNDGVVDFSNYLRFLWVFVKTNNSDTEPFEQFSEKLEIGDVLEKLSLIIELINKSVTTRSLPKKTKAAAILSIIRHPMKYWRLQRRVD